MNTPVIIAMSGRKGAGKNTVADFIATYWAAKIVGEGSSLEIESILRDYYLECSFADNLKRFCIDTLGVGEKQCYGSDEEKNTPTQYFWDNVPEFLRWKFGEQAQQYIRRGCPSDSEIIATYENLSCSNYAGVDPSLKTGPISGREIMQIFGTDLIRMTFGNVWAGATIRQIKKEGKLLSVITDNRFPNEVQAVLVEPNSYILRLTRSPYGVNDLHPSEASLDGYDWSLNKRCFVLDNSAMSIKEQEKATIPILEEIFGTEGVN